MVPTTGHEGAVVSENWIGYGNVQSPDIPVIRANHLIEKLKTTDSLWSTMERLKERKYLPKEESILLYQDQKQELAIGACNGMGFKTIVRVYSFLCNVVALTYNFC